MERPPPSLLLLPPPPSPVDALTINAAYRPSITAVVSTLKDQPTSNVLIIALPCPGLEGHQSKPRAEAYDGVQHLLSTIYSLFCAVCTKMQVDVESHAPGSIDARIILLADESTPSLTSVAAPLAPCGPIITLSSLALSRRQWNMIFSVDGEQGQSLMDGYKKFVTSTQPPRSLGGQIQPPVPAGVVMVQPPTSSTAKQSPPTSSHDVVAVGGTFDHIHAGHKLLLTTTAFLLQPSIHPRRLIVGITGDELLKKKAYREFLGTWKQRQEDVVEFLLSVLLFTSSTLEEESVQTTSFEPELPNGNDTEIPNGKRVHTLLLAQNITIECVEIQDAFGPTITDEAVTALVVSGETRSGGQAVNEERKKKGWHTLEVFEIDVLDPVDVEAGSMKKSEGFASKISSSAIRKRMAENRRASSL